MPLPAPKPNKKSSTAFHSKYDESPHHLADLSETPEESATKKWEFLATVAPITPPEESPHAVHPINVVVLSPFEKYNSLNLYTFNTMQNMHRSATASRIETAI